MTQTSLCAVVVYWKCSHFVSTTSCQLAAHHFDTIVTFCAGGFFPQGLKGTIK